MIKKNGSTYAGFEHVHSSTGTGTYPTVFGSALIPVVEGDIITTETYHNYGSAINVTDGSSGSWFHGYSKHMSTLKVNNIDTQTGSNIVVASGKVLSAPGHIIQVVRNIPATTSSVTLASSTMAELSTSYRTSITPKFASSLLRLNFNGLISGQNTSAIMTLNFLM